MQKSLWGLLPLVVGVGGCGLFGEDEENTEPVEVAAVAERTNVVVTDSVKNSVASLESIADLETFEGVSVALEHFEAILESFGGGDDQADGGGDTGFGKPFNSAGDGLSEGADGSVGDVDDDLFEDDPDEMAADIGEFLSTRVFVEENRESADVQSAVFLLRGEVTCVEICDVDDPECVEEADEACVEDLDALEIRIEAAPVGDDGVNLTFYVGPERRSPLYLELRTGSVAAEVDLAEAKAAAEFIDSIVDDGDETASGAASASQGGYSASGVETNLGDVSSGTGTDETNEDDDFELPEYMAGRIRLALVVASDQDITVEASILEAIEIRHTIDSGEIVLAVEPATPLWSVHANGPEKKLEILVDLNAVDVSLPWAELADESASVSGDVLSFHLGGMGFGITIDETIEQSLLVTGLNLGETTTTVKKDGDVLLGIDVNADSGRAFDLRVTPDHEQDSAVFAFEPEFDLRILLGLHHVADDLGSDFPQVLLDDTYSINLSGGQTPSLMPLGDNDQGFEGGLKVVDGTLTLSSQQDSAAAVTVQAGQCLTGRDEVPQGGHDLLGYFVAADCP